MEIASAVKAMRRQLGMTQDHCVNLAQESGYDIKRDEWVKVETGINQAGTVRIRDGLAAGLGLGREDLDELVNGAIDVVEAARRSRPPPPPRSTLHGVQRSGEVISSMYEGALLRVVDPEIHTIADLEATFAAIAEAVRVTGRRPDPEAVAREWLDAARSLRLAGTAATPHAVVALVALGQRT